VCDNVDVATLRYSTATELRVYVIGSTDGPDDRRFIIDVPAHGVRLSARRTVTMQVADDDASVPWELLASAREMLCAPSLVERDVCREQLVEGISRGGVAGAATESHRRPTSPTTVTTLTASRSACF
jgi:hypothetical protein